MYQPFELTMRLTLQAPLISSGGGDATRGLNRIFYRNADRQFALQGSHLKGKLREALQELHAGGAIAGVNLKELFGNENSAGHYLPEYAALRFSDFILQGNPAAPASQSLTRVSIDTQTGTSRESFLQMTENIAGVGASTEWEGKISFFAVEANQAKKLADIILLGLKWVTAVGAVKGSGYGRLENVVQVSLAPCQPRHTFPTKPVSRRDLTLIFTFDDDLLIGGVKKKKAVNYLESQYVIPGAVIKGALARFLNELCGNTVLTAGIDGSNAAVHQHFEKLAEYFSALQISHAFPCSANPAPATTPRAVTVPFSTVRTSENKFFDVAQAAKPQPDQQGRAPEFMIDWKDPEALNKDFGWAECEIINKTRTAIDPQTRRAHEEKLYTFQYLTPYVAGPPSNKQNVGRPKVKWIARVRFPELKTEQQQLLDEFCLAIKSGWQFLGKRGARFTCEVVPGHLPAKINSHAQGLLVDGLAVVALQTDALLFDGRTLAEKRDQIDLFEIYCHYWQQATKQSCELERFFARQKLWGGYLAQRYKLGPNYYPFVLTEAGSVFVLRAKDAGRAKTCLRELKENGLPLPEEISQQIAAAGKAPWQACPFVRENGFGEINLNLEWHWNNSFPAANEGGQP
jgi:hypothetical protein